MSDGSWGVVDGGQHYDPGQKGDSYKHPAGPTGLTLYALLKCGVPVDDASVKKGFKFLKDKHRIPGSSYEKSAVLLAVTATADPFKRYKASVAAEERVKLTGEFRKWAEDLRDALLKARVGASLGWRYQSPGTAAAPGGEQDLSSTMLASLALFAADRCKVKTPSAIWGDTITFALAQQEDDGPETPRAVENVKDKAKAPPPPAPSGAGGPDDPRGRYGAPPEEKGVMDKARGFAYIKGQKKPDEGEATGGMSACGVATILFGRHILFNRPNDKVWAKQDAKKIQQSIYDGLAWLDANFSSSQNPHKASENIYYVYYLYCVERAMDLVGVWRLGKHFWYIEMGQTILSKQKPQGFWDSNTTLNPRDVMDTCFALLFLKRATKGGIPYPSLTPTNDDGPAVDNRGKGEDTEDK